MSDGKADKNVFKRPKQTARIEQSKLKPNNVLSTSNKFGLLNTELTAAGSSNQRQRERSMSPQPKKSTTTYKRKTRGREHTFLHLPETDREGQKIGNELGTYRIKTSKSQTASH